MSKNTCFLTRITTTTHLTKKHWVVLFLVLIMGRLSASFIEFLNVDEFDYFLTARSMIDGGTFYRDFINPRYISFLFHALAQWLIPIHSTLSVHWLLIPVLAVSLYFLVDGVRSISSDRAAFWSGLGFAVFVTVGMPEIHAALSEPFANIFTILAFWFFVKGYFINKPNYIFLFFCGTMIALSGYGKQPAMIVLGAYGLFLFIEIIRFIKNKESIVIPTFSGLLVFLGFLILHSMVLLIHIPFNLVDSYIFYFWYGLFVTYIPDGFQETIYTITTRFFSNFGIIFLMQLMLWIGLIGFIVYKIKQKSIERQELLVSFLFIFTFLLFFLGGARFYKHYQLFSLPFLTILAGYWVHSFLLKHSSTPPIHKSKWNAFNRYKVILAGFVLPFCVAFVIYAHFSITIPLNPNTYWDDLHFFYPNKRYAETLEFLKSNLNYKDSLFIWGEEIALHYFTKAKIATPYLWCIFLTHYNPNLPIQSERERYLFQQYNLLLDNLELHKPKFIVDTSTDTDGIFLDGNIMLFPALHTLIKTHYFKITIKNEFTIYKRTNIQKE